MSVCKSEYVSELNELAQLSSDAAESHRRAVQVIQSANVARFCERRAEEHDTMASRFRRRIDELGETAEEGGTLRGAAEKLLSEARGLIDDEEKAVLAELVRIERLLIERINGFLDSGAPPETKAPLMEYYGPVTDRYRELCAMVSTTSTS